MKRFLQECYHAFMPEKVRWAVNRWLHEHKYKERKQQTIRYLKSSNDAELLEIARFLEKHPITNFPYDYSLNYKPENILVYKDESNGLFYVLYKGRRLYLKRGMLKSKIKTMINSLLIEQDMQSQHAYIDNIFTIEDKDVLYDVGAAEGIFTLGIIDKVASAYLFEVDESWIEALNYTFAPWKDKVTIVNKFVGNEDDFQRNLITLDRFSNDHLRPTFIKADIEGAEKSMLEGAQKLFLNSASMKVSICTYHKENDSMEIDQFLQESNFKTHFTSGYIYCYNLDFEQPCLAKGVVRGQK